MSLQKPNQDNISLLDLLSRVKRHVTTAPTYIPRNFFEQIVLFDNGSATRVYFYVNDGWYYVTLS